MTGVAEIATVAKGGWTGTGVVTSTGVVAMVVMMLIAMVKVAPKWKELGIGARRDLFEQLTARVDKLEKDNRELRDLLATAERTTNDVRMHMVTLNTACALLAGELDKVSPGNAVLIQAKELIRQAASDDLGWGEVGKRLSLMPGVKREIRSKAADDDA